MGARLLVMGGGRMGQALVGGLIASGWAPPSDLEVVEQLEPVRHRLRSDHPGLVVSEVPGPAREVVLAVKPADAEEACRELAASGTRRLLSIVAGVGSEQLGGWLAPGCVVVRAMSNTPALVRQGASAVAAGPSASDDDVVWAESILRAVGEVVRVPEDLLDAVTGLSGSGPAYVFLLAEALEEAGVELGLPRDVCRKLVAATISGSGGMLFYSGEEPAHLRRDVTSPGGTTAAGVRALRARGFPATVAEAVAADRSRQLGREGR
jgi:pyrroline-5-carboxylate reductase